MNPAITNVVIMLGMTQVSKQVPFDDPNVLNGVRALYVLSNLIIFGIYMYMKSKIDGKKDRTVLKYVEPPAMGSGEDPKLVTTTVHEYDTNQLKAALKGQAMGLAFMAVMHLYMKYTNPLLIQSILPVKALFEGNLAKLYLFNKPATGDLKRPWKAAGGFMGMQPGGEIKTDKASIEAAERSGRGGVKEE